MSNQDYEQEDRIGWNSRDGFTVDGQVMVFRRLPRDRKEIVATVFDRGLGRYDADYAEFVALADYYGLPLGDVVACVNYAQKAVDRLNLFDRDY